MAARSPGTADSRLEPNGKRVMDAVEDYLENCAHVIVDIEVVESLLRPENLEVSLKVRPEALNYKRQQYFPALRHIRETGPLCGKQKKMVGESGKRRQETGQNEWHDIEYQGDGAKVPPCPDSTLQTPLPQQSSSSAREEEGRWVLMEDRRRRDIAFENLAKEMLRYLDNSADVKVGIIELQERLEVPVQIGISIQQVAQQARSEDGQKMFLKYFGKKKKKRSMLLKAWSNWKEDVKT